MKTIAYDSKYSNQIINLWNRTLTVDPINRQRFLENIILDDNFTPSLCRIALDQDKVVGFIWAVKRKVPYGERGLETHRGWIVLVFVDPSYRRQGIGSQLIREVEESFTKRNVKLITLAAYSPNYLFPGIDIKHYANAVPFFEYLGYKKGNSAVSMQRDLFNFQFPNIYPKIKNELIEQGYRLSPFQLADAEELIDFLKTEFGGGWARNIKQALIQKNAIDTVLIVRNANHQIVGYCQRAIDGNPGRFGPFGVKANLRGKHLGMLLFNEMLFDMLQRQIYHVYFLWTGGSAQRFYAKNGMKVYRQYALMKKEVE